MMNIQVLILKKIEFTHFYMCIVNMFEKIYDKKEFILRILLIWATKLDMVEHCKKKHLSQKWSPTI